MQTRHYDFPDHGAATVALNAAEGLDSSAGMSFLLNQPGRLSLTGTPGQLDAVEAEFLQRGLWYPPRPTRLGHLMAAAHAHGEDSGLDYEVGDLEEIIDGLWAMLDEGQRNEFLSGDVARSMWENALWEWED
jgi:hypothetical protein